MKTTHRAFTLMEVSVAGAILAVVALVCAQVLAAMVVRGRELRRRQIAVQEAANQMERLHAADWDRLTPEWAAARTLSDEAARALPGVALKATITTPAERPNVRRLEVRLSWPERTDTVHAPVRLVAWRHGPTRASAVGKEVEP